MIDACATWAFTFYVASYTYPVHKALESAWSKKDPDIHSLTLIVH